MLDEVPVVGVHFAGLWDGVRMPEHLKKPSVLFEYGWNLPTPIPDLLPAEHGIFGTLSFSGSRFNTFVPWEAVFAIADKASGQGIVWQNDIPPNSLKRPPAARPNPLRLVK